mgnify:CR=1 FL=1
MDELDWNNCLDILNKITKDPNSVPFMVKVEKTFVDYYQVIKQPMDFETIRKKVFFFFLKKKTKVNKY